MNFCEDVLLWHLQTQILTRETTDYTIEETKEKLVTRNQEAHINIYSDL